VLVDRLVYPVVLGRFSRDATGRMSGAGPLPDVVAHEHAIRLPIPAVVRELVELLGARLVAYLGGVTETRTVRAWAAGTRAVRDPVVVVRLRLGLQLAAALVAVEHDPAIVQAWFQGLNPELDDRVPAQLLREGELATVGPELLAAMRAFLVSG